MLHIRRILLAGTVLWFLFSLFFFWLNAIVDSQFYWAFAEYLRTGNYPFFYPFFYTKPTTISPPLYSLLILVLESLPHPAVFLHAVQLIMLVCTSYLVYRVLASRVRPSVAVTIACLFGLIPTNLIYTTLVMSEILAQFLLTLCIFFFLKWQETRKQRILSWAVGIGALATLAKYSFVVYPAVAFLLLLITKAKTWRTFLLPMVGILLLAGWMYYNWAVTGVLGLSDTKGVQLYNQFIWNGRVAPPEAHDAVRELRKYVPAGIDLRQAYWDLQPYILPAVGYEWSRVDALLGAVARATVREYPGRYLLHGARSFISLHGTSPPYWTNLGSFGHQPSNPPLYCGRLGGFAICSPLVTVASAQRLWNAYIRFADLFHTYVFTAFTLGLVLPTLFFALIAGSRPLRIMALLYLAGVLPIALFVHVDTRYLIPFYPIMIIVSSLGIAEIYARIQRFHILPR